MTELTLYAIEAELEALVDSVETCPDELQPELEQRIARYVAAEAGKVDNIAKVLSLFDSVERHAKVEIERLRARRESAEKNARRLEAYLLHILAGRGGQPLKGYNVTFSARRTEALIVDDPEAVPPEWKRTTVSVDIPKDPLKRALQAGESIAGVHIEERQHLVRR